MRATIPGKTAEGDPSATNECVNRFSGRAWALGRRLGLGHADAGNAIERGKLMSRANDVLAAMLRTSTRGLAGCAASELLDSTPEATTSLPLTGWQDLLAGRVEVGRMWLTNEITVAEEHFVTTTTRIVLDQLRSCIPFPPWHGKTLVAAAVMGNHHDLGLQMVGDFFELDGWRVIYLGASMPVEDLVQAIRFYRPDLLGLSVALTTQLPVLKATIAAVRRTPRGAAAKILVGGAALSGTTDSGRPYDADDYAADAAEAVTSGNRLVGR